MIDFPAWTCIGMFLAYIYGIAVFDQNPKVFLDGCGPYEFLVSRDSISISSRIVSVTTFLCMAVADI